MKEKDKYWIWLSIFKDLKNKTIQELIKKFGTIEEIYKAKKKELLTVNGINEDIADQMTNEIYKRKTYKYQKCMEKNNIDIISIESEEYPNILRQIYDMPIYLFVKGNKSILNGMNIAIIGCRQATNYGIETAKNIAYKLALKNINIVSGLAKGIDTSAHIGTLNAKGRTIAVLGSGLDIIYPKENYIIANEIVNRGGILISEYIPGTMPEKFHFPQRNRIISGLSIGVVVVEAKEKSGSMITVDFALEQGRDIFAVPGSINWRNSVGCNKLISEGAVLVQKPEDILEYYSQNK